MEEIINSRIASLIVCADATKKQKKAYNKNGILVIVAIAIVEAVLLFGVPLISEKNYFDAIVAAITSIVIALAISTVLSYFSEINRCDDKIYALNKEIYELGKDLYLNNTMDMTNKEYFEKEVLYKYK